MRTIDRYIITHFMGPFVVGVAAFAAIIMGVSEIYWAVNLIVADHVPAGLVLQAFLLHMPGLVALTMPMATVFAALMASGELSAHGEIVAMRAGGVGLWRMARPVIVGGLAIALLASVFNEALGPLCNARGNGMVREYVSKSKLLDKYVMVRMPEEGQAQRIIYADKLDLRRQVLEGVTIIEFEKGSPRQVFFAREAQWVGKQWRLVDVLHKQDTGAGYREDQLSEMLVDIGRTPDQIRSSPKKRPEDLTLRQLRVEAAALELPARTNPKDAERRWWLIQHFHLRLAAPWAAVCFCILGFPLGLRPQRTSTGIGFGLSLAIIFVYYIVFNSLRAFGEQGALSPVIAAWTPNFLVLGVGLGLMLNASR
jgi:lipopolysaccharide export system permease protein